MTHLLLAVILCLVPLVVAAGVVTHGSSRTLAGLAVALLLCSPLEARAVTFSGTLRDRNGTGVPNQHVSLGGTATTAADGSFVIEQPLGTYELQLYSVDGADHGAAIVPDRYQVNGPSIQLNGNMVQDLTLAGVVVSVTAVDPAQHPVPNTAITLLPAGAESFELYPGGTATGFSDFASGMTDGSGVAAGLVIFPTTSATIYAAPPPGSHLGGATAMVEGPSVDSSYTIGLPPAVTFSGTLRDRNGTGVPNQHVSLGGTATTAADGSFVIEQALGTYELQLYSVDGADHGAAIVPDRYQVNGPSIQLNGNMVQDLTLAGVVVSVTAVDPAQHPVPNTAITLLPAGAESFELYPGGTATGFSDFASGMTDGSGVAAGLVIFPTTSATIYAAPPPGFFGATDAVSGLDHDTGFSITVAPTTCGDGQTDPNEQCDAGTANGTSCCSVRCAYLADGASCDDGNPCTYSDTCDNSHQCAGASITCTNDQCNIRSCNGTASCTVTPNAGQSCDDSDACTYGDTCDGSGQCAGSTITCTNDECNIRTCNGTSSCVVTSNTGSPCGSGGTCDSGGTCVTTTTTTTTTLAAETTTTTTLGGGTTTTTVPPLCGDGLLGPGEQCDDGNTNDMDACKNDCTPNVCGDGYVFTGVEECDDHNTLDGDGCDHTCMVETRSASGTVGSEGVVTTDTGGGATPSQPTQAAVTTPGGGTVTITVSATTPSPPPGYQVLTGAVQITAPAATANDPLALVFTVDASVIPTGQDPSTIAVLKDGLALADCTGAPGTASPDPCVSSRDVVAGGDVQLTIFTSTASQWAFAAPGVSTTTTTTTLTTTTSTTLPAAACAPTPASGCRIVLRPLASSVQIKNDPDNTKDQFKWKWKNGGTTAVSDFMDPVTRSATHRLCVYDSSGRIQPLMQMAVASGGTCDTKPCWKALGTVGFSYKSKLGTPNGLTGMQLKAATPTRESIQAKGKGSNLPTPVLPLTLPVTVQLVIGDTSGTQCWQTTYTTKSANTAAVFGAKGP